MRPEVGTQAQFKKKKAPEKYRYDDSLAPSLEWDGQNPARERGEARISTAETELATAVQSCAALDGILKAAQLSSSPIAESAERVRARVLAAQATVRELKAMSKPFLNWAGKAERMSFEVPTLPLFIHERLSTKAILETLKGHQQDRQTDMFELFGDPQHSIVDQALKAYEFPDKWVNRMILGDSLVVMNSLLHYENLGGQVQMIYMDPPYGVKFGSNFQPFVRKRDVSHNDDEDMTREPEMVQAYRDTWELGLHSYLTYLRDRLLLARDLLSTSGSIFVQIGEDNVHNARELLDEVFGPEQFVSLITFKKTGGSGEEHLDAISDYLLWYARDSTSLYFKPLFQPKDLAIGSGARYTQVENRDGLVRPITRDEQLRPELLPEGSRVYLGGPLTSQTPSDSTLFEFEFGGKNYKPRKGGWKTNYEGMMNLISAGRIIATKEFVNYKLYFDDFPFVPVTNLWDDTMGTAERNKMYVVQTATKVIQRCMLMTSNPEILLSIPPAAAALQLMSLNTGADAGLRATRAVCRWRWRGSDSSRPLSTTTN
jgi:adenine-specific DNA-methyltransferase